MSSSPVHAKGRVPLEVLQLAERGAKLFPLAPHSKIPLVSDWQNENNTSDPLDLEYILQQAPDCNWGMVCGPRSGIFALDYDCRNGRPGLAWYQHALEEHGPEWADTIRVRTPSTGKHTYHQWVEGIGKDNSGKLAEGVDIQGAGSYVVIPPSEVDGRHYEFEDCDGEKTIAPLPAWLLGDLQRVFVPASQNIPEKVPEKVPKKVPIGQRHDTLLRQGKALARAGASWQAILREFEILNQQFEEWIAHNELEYQAKDIYQRYRPRVHLGAVNGTRIVPEAGEWVLVPFSEIQTEPIDWLEGWEPYFPIGMPAMLTGDPGVGKSFIAISIAAKITREGGKVFYLTLENHPRKVLRPRFDSCGGEPSNIFWAKAVQFGDPSDGLFRTVTLQDMGGLEKKVRELHPRLIVIDPLQSFLGANIDLHRANETRPVLDKVAELAERENLLPLILRHAGKAQKDRTIHRGLGSIDFTGAVRSELFAGETADHKQKAMAHIKSNVGPLGKTLGYKITGMNEEGLIIKTGYFSWTGESDLNCEDLTAPEQFREEMSALEEAERFLVDYLGDGPKWQKEVIKKSRAEGIKEHTLRRAKERLKLGWEKRDGVYWWFLPSTYK